MTISTQDLNRRRLWAFSAAGVYFAAGAAYLALEAVAAAGFRPDYSYIHNMISDLGVTSRGVYQGHVIDSPLAYLMNTAFCLQGTLFLAGALIIVRASESRRFEVFLAFAVANAVGNILVAAFHSGPIAHADGTIAVHEIGALLAIVGGNLAILAGSSIVRKAVAPPWYRGVSVGLAVFGLLSFVLLVIELQLPAFRTLPPAAWERGSVYTITTWQLLTGTVLLTRSR